MPRDQRTFITVHDGMPEHPKVEPLSDAAFRLMVETWCWCARQLTDGHMPAAIWTRRSTAEARQELIDAGLVEVTDSGVSMHDYTEHQRTAAEVAALREKRADAGRRGGLAKASNALASASPVAKQTASNLPSKSLADTETDTETDKERAPRKRARTPIDPEWLPEPDVRQKVAAENPGIDLKAEHAKFIDHFIATGKTMKDWTAAWRNWMRRASEYSPKTTKAQQPGGNYFTAPPPPDDMPSHLFAAWNRAHAAAHKQGTTGPQDWHELQEAS